MSERHPKGDNCVEVCSGSPHDRVLGHRDVVQWKAKAEKAERQRDEAVDLAARRAGALDNSEHRGMKYMEERDEALRAYEALGKLDSANTDALGLAESSIKRIEALVERMRNGYAGEAVFADELETALAPESAKHVHSALCIGGIDWPDCLASEKTGEPEEPIHDV